MKFVKVPDADKAETFHNFLNVYRTLFPTAMQKRVPEWVIWSRHKSPQIDSETGSPRGGRPDWRYTCKYACKKRERVRSAWKSSRARYCIAPVGGAHSKYIYGVKRIRVGLGRRMNVSNIIVVNRYILCHQNLITYLAFLNRLPTIVEKEKFWHNRYS